MVSNDVSCGYSYTNPSVKNLIASSRYRVQSCSSSDLVSLCAAGVDIEASLLAAWCCWQYGGVRVILGAAGNTNDGRMTDPGVLWMRLLSTTIKQEAVILDAFSVKFTHLTSEELVAWQVAYTQYNSGSWCGRLQSLDQSCEPQMLSLRELRRFINARLRDRLRGTSV